MTLYVAWSTSASTREARSRAADHAPSCRDGGGTASVVAEVPYEGGSCASPLQFS